MLAPGFHDPGVGPRVFNGGSQPVPCTEPGVGRVAGERARTFEELRRVMLEGCDIHGDQDFHGLLHEGLPDRRCVLQLGITLLQLLLLSPRDGAFMSGVCALVKNTATPTLRDRDVLPLPIPPLGAVLRLCRHLSRRTSGLLVWDPRNVDQLGKQQGRKLVKASCFQVWRLLIVTITNGEYLDWCGTGFSLGALAEAFAHLDELCRYFCRDPLNEKCGLSPEEVLRTKGISYTGDEVLHALPLRVQELLPGLPADGVAGTLQAADVAEGEVAKWVCDPMLTLLPEDKWPHPMPSASMNCSRSDWLELVPLLVHKNILKPIPKSEIFRVRGSLLLNGAFAVPKKGTPAEGEVRVTRLIMNMIPSNALQRLMPGDLATLSSASAWVGAHLHPGQVLLWSGEDQRGAYYAWALPPVWRQFMAFRWPVPGSLVGLPNEPEVYVAAAVIPMGWVNAVGLFQHLHRRLGLSSPPGGAGHSAEVEWRRDRPIPSSVVTENGGWVQFYLDDFDCPEFVDKRVWKRIQGTFSTTHRNQRQAYNHVGVEVSEDKSHARVPRVVRMGAEIDGVAGFIGPPSEKILETGWLCLWLLCQVCVGVKPLLMALGRLVRCFEFRRPLLSILDRCWPRDQFRFRRTLNQSTRRELLRAVCALPLAVGSLRIPYSGLVTCSDASTQGGGLCASAGLAGEGLRMPEKLNKGDVQHFQPAGAIDIKGGVGPRVLAVSIFNDIGALVVALSRLPCQVVGYASCETNKEMKRVLRRRWPGIIELGDISKVDEKVIDHLQRSFVNHLDFVLVGASCPYQGKGTNSHEAVLFAELLRVIGLLKSFFTVPVHYFVENVASLSESAYEWFNSTLQSKPILVDAKWFTWCHRPRYFWCSWMPYPQQDEEMRKFKCYDEWIFPLCRDRVNSWLQQDGEWNGHESGWLPCLTQPQARTKPPSDALGLAEASTGAVERWKADDYRLPVANYEVINMIGNSEGVLRLPSLCERELLMGFDKGYIEGTLPHKMSHEAKFMLGGKMLGRTQCVHVLVMLVHSLLSLFGHSEARVHRELIRQIRVAPPSWLLHPRFVDGSFNTLEAQQLVQHFCRQAEKNGSDVRLDVGIPFRAKAWPRAGINSSLFHWSVVHGYAWKHSAHINVLELQAVLNGLKWRLRKSGNGRCRILHLIDNQVVCSIIAKGRSSSLRLKRGLKKLNSLVLASGIILAVGYVATDSNPSDIPSRWGGRSQVLKRTKESRVGRGRA